jgi:hypothetical protein
LLLPIFPGSSGHRGGGSPGVLTAEAQRRIYGLDPAGLVELEDWLRRFKRFWGGRLDALERQLGSTHPDDTPRNTP